MNDYIRATNTIKRNWFNTYYWAVYWKDFPLTRIPNGDFIFWMNGKRPIFGRSKIGFHWRKRAQEEVERYYVY